jgi:hypothetical protein
MSPTSDEPTDNIKLRRELNDKLLLKCFPSKGFVQFEEVRGKVDFLSERHLRLRLYECADKGYLVQIAKRGLDKEHPLKKLNGLYLYEITALGLAYRETQTEKQVKRRKLKTSKVYNPETDETDDPSKRGTFIEELSPGVKRVTNMYMMESKTRVPRVDAHDVRDLVNSVFALGEVKHRKA